MHAGTGGVGLAAIDIATALRCPISATAGTPQKRSLLRDLGVRAAASSRDTSFLDVTCCKSGAASLQLQLLVLVFVVHTKVHGKPASDILSSAVAPYHHSAEPKPYLHTISSSCRGSMSRPFRGKSCAGPVDFALNSLTSPAMVAATLASLALNGRMAEISKRDIWSPQRVAQERPDVSYKLIAIDFLSPQVPRLSLPPTTAIATCLACS